MCDSRTCLRFASLWFSIDLLFHERWQKYHVLTAIPLRYAFDVKRSSWYCFDWSRFVLNQSFFILTIKRQTTVLEFRIKLGQIRFLPCNEDRITSGKKLFFWRHCRCFQLINSFLFTAFIRYLCSIQRRGNCESHACALCVVYKCFHVLNLFRIPRFVKYGIISSKYYAKLNFFPRRVSVSFR